MKKLLLLSLIFFHCSIACFAQDSTQLKRQPYKLKVMVDKKNLYEEDLKESPYVWPDNTIQMYPGEKLFAEAEIKDGAIVKITAVKENTNPEKTLTISFTQVAEGKVHQQMMLKISNPFDKTLTYAASIFILNHSKWVKTSVIPVAPGLSSFESWPDVIISIGIGNWALKN